MIERVKTSMVFTPGEGVTEALFNFLSEEAAEEVIDAKMPLNFYSEHEYEREDRNTPDLTLNQFKRRLEGTNLPLFPDVVGDYWLDRGNDNRPQNGLDIKVKVDVSKQDDVLRQAQLLGFAGESKLILARLAIPAGLLAPSGTHGQSINRLRGYVTFPPSYGDRLVGVSFVDTLLTD